MCVIVYIIIMRPYFHAQVFVTHMCASAIDGEHLNALRFIWSKWSPLFKWHISMHCVFIQITLKWSRGSSINNALALIQPLQAIIWACIDQDLCRHMASWGYSGIHIPICVDIPISLMRSLVSCLQNQPFEYHWKFLTIMWLHNTGAHRFK